jgi:hypothetical protein
MMCTGSGVHQAAAGETFEGMSQTVRGLKPWAPTRRTHHTVQKMPDEASTNLVKMSCRSSTRLSRTESYHATNSPIGVLGRDPSRQVNPTGLRSADHLLGGVGAELERTAKFVNHALMSIQR